MNKATVKATTNSRRDMDTKRSDKIDSEYTSSESDVGESEEDEEDSVEEPKEDTGAHGSFGSDQVGHPEASPPHLFPTPPPDSGAKMVARKTTLRSEILSAIDSLGNKTGSSVQAILKFMKNNGHEVTDQRRFSVQVRRSLKMSIRNGQVEQVKQSFKLTKNANNKRKSLEKLKANKAKEKAKEKESKAKQKAIEKESKAKAKKEAKEAKDIAKANEKATKEKPSKKQALKEGTTGKADAAKPVKKARKSIGTLAQPMAKKPKVNAKAVKQLVAGKGKDLPTEDLGVSIDGNMLEAQATSTPNMVGKGKATRKRK